MDAQDVIDRAKNSQYFTVKLALQKPLQFRGGRVPFDIQADTSTAVFNVLAETQAEADEAVAKWMKENE